jgi:hypothetical protein
VEEDFDGGEGITSGDLGRVRSVIGEVDDLGRRSSKLRILLSNETFFFEGFFVRTALGAGGRDALIALSFFYFTGPEDPGSCFLIVASSFGFFPLRSDI